MSCSPIKTFQIFDPYPYLSNTNTVSSDIIMAMVITAF